LLYYSTLFVENDSKKARKKTTTPLLTALATLNRHSCLSVCLLLLLLLFDVVFDE